MRWHLVWFGLSPSCCEDSSCSLRERNPSLLLIRSPGLFPLSEDGKSKPVFINTHLKGTSVTKLMVYFQCKPLCETEKKK
jgi:hypothetical protein